MSGRRLRILWVSHVIPYPPKAGVLLRAYHLLKGVAARHDVDLYAFIQEPWLRTLFPDPRSGLEECRTELSRFCRRVEFTPIPRVHRTGGQARAAFESLFYSHGYVAGWLYSKVATAALGSLATNNSYDLVHFDTIALAQYRPIFAAVPATLGHHNIESEMLSRRAAIEENVFKRWYFRQEARRLRRFEIETAGSFAAHITCSDVDSRRLSLIVPNVRAIVVPNGVDTEYFQPQGIAERPQSLIFVGTMNWYPNVDAVQFLLDKVWPAVHRAKPKATLDIVGANAPDAIRALAATSPGVALRGFVPEVRPLIESAALYVCPIRDGGGTKLKILDACAMARCIVAHPVACEGIDLEPGRHVVLAADADTMIAEILRLFDDPQARIKMGRAARTLVQQRYAFSSIAQHFADSLVDIVASEQAKT